MKWWLHFYFHLHLCIIKTNWTMAKCGQLFDIPAWTIGTLRCQINEYTRLPFSDSPLLALFPSFLIFMFFYHPTCNFFHPTWLDSKFSTLLFYKICSKYPPYTFIWPYSFNWHLRVASTLLFFLFWKRKRM